MRTANPTLTADIFRGAGQFADVSQTMTIQGTINRIAFLSLLVLATSVWIWNMYFVSGDSRTVIPWIIGGCIGGLGMALLTIFKMQWAPITTPLYALLEGLVLGGISSVVENAYPGIVIQAVLLTFCTLICMLLAYKTGHIKATENFKMGIVSATGAILLIYIVTFILGLFGLPLPFIHENGMIGIGLSIFIVIIAALNLVIDFDFIENGAARGSAKYMEWYGAFALMVTLIWFYLEILHLLSKLASRNC